MASRVGILALQGGVAEHAAHLRDCGYEPVLVRRPQHLRDLTALILPGGESTAMRRLLAHESLDRAIIEAANAGLYVWGSCAGAILAAAAVVGEQACLGLIDIEVERNIFGAQLASFVVNERVLGVSEEAIDLVFIRAPGFRRVWGNARAMHTTRGHIVAAESERVLATSFHPELSRHLDFHRYFLKKAGLSIIEKRDRRWDRTRWMRQ